MIILIDKEQGLEKIQHQFKIKTVSKLRREGNYLNNPTSKRASIKNLQLKSCKKFPLEL